MEITGSRVICQSFAAHISWEGRKPTLNWALRLTPPSSLGCLPTNQLATTPRATSSSCQTATRWGRSTRHCDNKANSTLGERRPQMESSWSLGRLVKWGPRVQVPVVYSLPNQGSVASSLKKREVQFSNNFGAWTWNYVKISSETWLTYVLQREDVVVRRWPSWGKCNTNIIWGRKAPSSRCVKTCFSAHSGWNIGSLGSGWDPRMMRGLRTHKSRGKQRRMIWSLIILKVRRTIVLFITHLLMN